MKKKLLLLGAATFVLSATLAVCASETSTTNSTQSQLRNAPPSFSNSDSSQRPNFGGPNGDESDRPAPPNFNGSDDGQRPDFGGPNGNESNRPAPPNGGQKPPFQNNTSSESGS